MIHTIDRVEVFVLSGADRNVGFASDMPAPLVSHTILRLTTTDGLVGVAGADSYTEYEIDMAIAETLRSMAPIILGQSILNREKIWNDVYPKVFPRAPQAHSLIDVAIWDALSRLAGMPLCKFLGGARENIRSYASTPLLKSPEAYVDIVAKLREEGYSAIKFHCWCEEAQDLRMIEAVRKAHGGGEARFMLDVEQRYNLSSALRVGRVLSELDYEWFEAPLNDCDLAGYKKLTAELRVPIVCAGNLLTDPRLIAFGLSHNCWDLVRIDATTCGGITPALKVMNMASASGVRVELQSWGHALVQAANLHLMLGQGNCTYFEQPIMNPEFLEIGVLAGIRTNRDGFVTYPDRPGLGIILDDNVLSKLALTRLDIA